MRFRDKMTMLALVTALLAAIVPLTGQHGNIQPAEIPNFNQESQGREDGEGGDRNLLLIQQDKVVTFDPVTGVGAQTGTATGRIKGVSIVNFRFLITTFPNFTFNNRAGITDLDGDQIIFKNVGTGRFVFPALVDPTLLPGQRPYQVFSNGLGGPLRGTYEVVATSGKYRHRYAIGQTFPYRAVAYNPSAPPAPGQLGSVYVEVSLR